MNGTPCRFLLQSIFQIASFLAITSPLAAQEPDLSGLANGLAERIRSSKVKSVVVSDFMTPLGAEAPTGKYLAAKLVESWGQHDQKFKVVERERLQTALDRQKKNAKDVGDEKTLKDLGKDLNAEAIMIGAVEALSDRLMLCVSVRKLLNGKLVASGQQSFPRSGVLESLNQSIPPSSLDALPRGGVNGVSVASCDFCPQPEFPTEAKVAKIPKASTLLDVVVTPVGTSAGIKILKDPGYRFAEEAIEAVRRWRFRPSVDKDKSPIAARVQIEVTFWHQ
jgi:TonB family protein